MLTTKLTIPGWDKHPYWRLQRPRLHSHFLVLLSVQYEQPVALEWVKQM